METYIVGTDELPDRQTRAKRELGRYLTPRERACTFKVKHSQRTAEAEASRLKACGEDRAKAYRCENPACTLPSGDRAWHVGRRKRTP